MSKRFKKGYILIALIIISILVGGIFYYEGTLPPQAQSKEPATFVIQKGSSVNTIINNLYKEGLIRNKLAFYVVIKRLGIESSIQAGLFRLSPGMTANEIAYALTQGSDDVWITIIEGIRKEEVAHILAKELDVPETEFIKAAEEGTLFPDTYLMPRDSTIPTILTIFKNNYDKKYSSELREKARARGFSDNDVLTLASLVEREANTEAAKKQVASIIVKRLENDWPLQIDATIQYALGYQQGEATWWKRHLTKADLALNSPYNTYLRTGLPPTPIASPGIDAIQAVINADASTPYWFYISDKAGANMYYARTLDEHNENIRKHLR